MSERFFEKAGRDLGRIGRLVAQNQNIARLLVYPSSDPLAVNQEQPNVDGLSLVGKNITFIPYTDDNENVTESTIMILFDRFWQNRANKDYKLLRIRFHVICPMRSWTVKDMNLRPLLIMSELDQMFNGQRIAGLVTMEFDSADRMVISPYLSGYVIDYLVDTFN